MKDTLASLSRHTAYNVIYALWILSITLLSGCSTMPAADTLATRDIENYNDRLAQWNVAKQSHDVKKMFDFASSHSNFIMDWQSPEIIYKGLDVALSVKWKTAYQYYHDTFLPEIQQTIDLMHLYQRATTSHSDADIANLAIFAKTHPLYANILDDLLIRGEHEKAVFALVKQRNTLPAYDEFLALYPAGAYATEATTLRNNLAAIEQDAENKVAFLQRQGVEEAQKSRADASSKPSPTSESSLDYPSPAVVRFRNMIEEDQWEILVVAHPSTVSDNHASYSSTTRLVQNGDGTVSIVDTISWKGPFSKKDYRTILTFTILSGDSKKIDSIGIEVEEINNPTPPAFQVAEIFKKKVINVIVGWMVKRNIPRQVISDIINESLPTKTIFAKAMQYMANKL